MSSLEFEYNLGVGETPEQDTAAWQAAVDQAQESEKTWDSKAACLGTDKPELFYPKGWGKKYLADILAAKAICATCTVQIDCLEYALEHGETDGVWGGTTAPERRKIMRERKLPYPRKPQNRPAE